MKCWILNLRHQGFVLDFRTFMCLFFFLNYSSTFSRIAGYLNLKQPFSKSAKYGLLKMFC